MEHAFDRIMLVSILHIIFSKILLLLERTRIIEQVKHGRKKYIFRELSRIYPKIDRSCRRALANTYCVYLFTNDHYTLKASMTYRINFRNRRAQLTVCCDILLRTHCMSQKFRKPTGKFVESQCALCETTWNIRINIICDVHTTEIY